MIWVWIAVTVIAIIVEAVSAQLLSIWFALGGIAALITSLFTDSIAVQIIVFVAVSVISLAVIFPFVKNILKKDAYLGEDRYSAIAGCHPG